MLSSKLTLFLVSQFKKREDMRIVVQRVLQASVESEGEIVGAIDRGIMVLLGLSTEDAVSDLPELYPWVCVFCVVFLKGGFCFL